MSALNIGDIAPDFTLPADGDRDVSLSDFKGKTVVVYFYPRDDTPGCTKQAIGFTERLGDFEAADAVVIGISKDTVTKHDKFRDKHDLKVILASDADGDVTERFGVWVEKKMYGKTYMGIERSTFVINPDGTLKAIWRKVKVPGHVDAVLDAIKA